MSLEIEQQQPIFAPEGNVVGDQRIRLSSEQAQRSCPYLLRRVLAVHPETGQPLVFLTNLHTLSAATIARIYRDRWQVELFFKALKQNLKIKTFVGTSENAVKTQIWTALIAMLILKYLQMKSTFGWSLSNLAALLRQQLFIFRDLWEWLNAPWEGPPAARARAVPAGGRPRSRKLLRERRRVS